MMALIVLVLFSTLGLVSVSLFSSDISIAFDTLRSTQALYLAEAGKQYVFEQLSHDSDWSNNANILNKVMGGGVFSAEYLSKNPSDAVIKFSGTKENVTRKFTVKVVKKSLAGLYGVYIGGQLHDQNTTNLTIGGDVVQNLDEDELPQFDFAYYQGIADHIVPSKTFESGLTYTGIWYVSGNVSFGSNVTLNGSVIATGNINMSDQSNINITATSPNPALVTEGNLQFQKANNVIINGLVYVGSDMDANALGQNATNITINGTLIVAGNLNIQNSDDITILTGDDQGSGIIDAPVYSSWQETT